MKMDDVPALKSNQFPERLNLAITQETHARLEILKSKHGKSPTNFLRKIIDEALDKIGVEMPGKAS